MNRPELDALAHRYVRELEKQIGKDQAQPFQDFYRRRVERVLRENADTKLEPTIPFPLAA
jgi:hypothetical protein